MPVNQIHLFSPDGNLIAYFSTEDPVGLGRATAMQEFILLLMVKSWRLKATPDENGGIAGWTADGKNIIWTEANKTLNSVYVLSTDGKSITEWNKRFKGSYWRCYTQ
jgi:hypothetical protein